MATNEVVPHNPLEGDRPEFSINLHDGSEEQIAIIIIHKDRPEYLNICLQSIAVCSFNNNYEIIVVDNASGKDTQDYLDSIQSEVKVIRNDKNLMWSAACNRGVAAADKNSKYFVFMHCDVVITSNAWLDLLVNVSESQKSGCIGVELGAYKIQEQQVDYVQEWLMLVTRDCFNAVKGWPESLPLVGHAFILTMLAQQGGYAPQVMRNPIAHHYKIFAVDINFYEREVERSMVELPNLLRIAQSQAVRPL